MDLHRKAVRSAVGVVALSAALVLPLYTPDAEPVAVSAPAESTAEEPLYTFVAAPDFLNQDVGDVRRLPGWRPGEPNSWTPQLQSSVDTFLDEIAGTHPDSVLVTGDLVEGHWLRDVDSTGVFGPSRTVGQRRTMLRRAAGFYESAYLQRFTDRGLVLHAAVGDHDIGDDPWRGSPLLRRKHRMVPLFKSLFAKHFTRDGNGTPRYRDRPHGTPWADTAYATQLNKDLLLVSLDVFHVTKNDVRPEVVGGQLKWLRHVLQRAKAHRTKWIVVQGHTPIDTPVRARSSSRLSLEKGTDSPLWKTMARYGVDVYLTGEVHDTSMVRADGITQISTGGLLYLGEATYMTATVYADRIDFDVHEFDWERSGRRGKLWQLGAYRTSGGRELVPGSSHSVATMTLTDRGRVEDATGKLIAYHPG